MDKSSCAISLADLCDRKCKTSAIVLSFPRKKHTGTCLVVSLSLDPPNVIEGWHYRFPQNAYPCMVQNTDIWAKGDMLTHAAFPRLDRPLENHVRVRRLLHAVHLREVLKAVEHAINCIYLVKHI